MSDPLGQLRSDWSCVMRVGLHFLKRAPFVWMPAILMSSFSIDFGRLPSVSVTLKPSLTPTGTGRFGEPFFDGENEADVV